uniref:C-type lectin domain-containing protein n=1 Tax=Panagrolaimus sp. ES5 TaxID=591445 RepID=A0AC34F046_9BILA
MLKIYFLAIFLLKVKALCPAESFEWQTSCYFFHLNSSGFAAAEATCVQNNNGHLCSIHDGFTNSLLAQEADIYFHESTVTDFWIGLTNLMPGGNWTWTDGTKFDFSAWDSSEPKNATGNNCVTLSLSNGLWKADDCFKLKPFVCKIDKSFYEPSTTSYPVYANCTYPFTYFEPTHSCYGVGNWTDPLNWTQGEQYCLGYNGHLTSIHSYQEQDFLRALHYMLQQPIWTGAISYDGGIKWEWSDGTIWDYNPWSSDSPSLNTSACGELWAVGLFDYPCSAIARIICKVKL